MARSGVAGESGEDGDEVYPRRRQREDARPEALRLLTGSTDAEQSRGIVKFVKRFGNLAVRGQPRPQCLMVRKTIVSTVLVFICASAAAFAQQVQQTIRIDAGDGGAMSILPPGRTPKTGTSGLRGRIVASDTGTPVRRAQVRISGPDIGTKSPLTANQGRYEFKELPAGRFNVSVSKSGYVTMQYGQNRPFEPGRPIELADAQVLEKTDVALPRGGVLAGRVIDEAGEAVAEADVTAMRMQFQNGKRRLVPSGRNASTNDLGQFRLYGLPPGEYFVSATLRSMGSMVIDLIGAGSGGPTGSNQSSGYAATYYPSTPNPAEAQRGALTVSQEPPGVDIQLQPISLSLT